MKLKDCLPAAKQYEYIFWKSNKKVVLVMLLHHIILKQSYLESSIDVSFQAQMLADINSAFEDTRSQLKKSASLAKKGRKPHHKLDPDAPKKPANAFFMFCQQQRNSMHDDQKDSSVGHHELTKHLAKEWNTLGAEGKKVDL